MAPEAQAKLDAGEPTSFEKGQRCLTLGDATAAVEHLKDCVADDASDSIDARLLLAEALWQESRGKGTEEALEHYIRAGELALKAQDYSKQAMVGLGYGFALTHLGRSAEAVDVLLQAKEAAAHDGPESPGVQFVERLLDQARSLAAEGSKPLDSDGADAVHVTWKLFAEARAAKKPAVLFMKGTLAAPLGPDSREGVEKLKQIGCKTIEVVDVADLGTDVPDGLQAISNSKYLVFPQLYISGEECLDWNLPKVSGKELREKLIAAGLEVGEMVQEPCHGTGAFADGLEKWETALVELVSQHGVEDLATLASKLKEQGHDSEVLAAEKQDSLEQAIKTAWERLAPVVKEKLEDQPEMPCGHSCNTCPTRHDCQLHDALGEAKDIEDLIVAPKKK